MLGDSIGRLRIAGILEGISFVVLLCIAMPLKYVWDQPLAVRIVGMIHGILFVVYCFVLLFAMLDRDWSVRKAAFYFLAALVPFGPFWVDPGLRREQNVP